MTGRVEHGGHVRNARRIPRREIEGERVINGIARIIEHATHICNFGSIDIKTRKRSKTSEVFEHSAGIRVGIDSGGLGIIVHCTIIKEDVDRNNICIIDN